MNLMKANTKKYMQNLPNFLTGLGSVLDIAGNYLTFDFGKDGSEEDTKAIGSDWEAIGEDIKKAKKDFKVTF